MEKRMQFSIEGKSALLTNNPAKMENAKPKGGGTSKGHTITYDPVEEAEAGLYVADGKYCFPSIGIRNSVIRAASEWKPLTGKKRGTLTTTVAHIVIEPEMVPILTHANKPQKEYEIDRRRAVVQKQGIIRSRPKFNEWRLNFEVVYDDDIIPMEDGVVREMFEGLLNDAGKRVGLGDYRPAKSGWFGTFKTISVNGKK